MTSLSCRFPVAGIAKLTMLDADHCTLLHAGVHLCLSTFAPPRSPMTGNVKAFVIRSA